MSVACAWELACVKAHIVSSIVCGNNACTKEWDSSRLRLPDCLVDLLHVATACRRGSLYGLYTEAARISIVNCWSCLHTVQEVLGRLLKPVRCIARDTEADSLPHCAWEEWSCQRASCALCGDPGDPQAPQPHTLHLHQQAAPHHPSWWGPPRSQPCPAAAPLVCCHPAVTTTQVTACSSAWSCHVEHCRRSLSRSALQRCSLMPSASCTHIRETDFTLDAVGPSSWCAFPAAGPPGRCWPGASSTHCLQAQHSSELQAQQGENGMREGS